VQQHEGSIADGTCEIFVVTFLQGLQQFLAARLNIFNKFLTVCDRGASQAILLLVVFDLLLELDFGGDIGDGGQDAVRALVNNLFCLKSQILP